MRLQMKLLSCLLLLVAALVIDATWPWTEPSTANDETEATIKSITDTPNKGEDLTITATFKLNKQEHIRHIIDCEECKETTDAVACKLVASQTAFKEYTPKVDKYYYGISIMNGKQLGAGTSSPEAFISLIGRSGHSGKLYLQGFLSLLSGNTIHQDTWDNVIIESNGDLGEILVVILGIDESIVDDPWYVNEVGVYNFQSSKHDAFSCYHWIGNGDSISITAQTTTIKLNEGNKILLTQRERQLQKRRSQYIWKKLPSTGLPSCFEDKCVHIEGLENKLPLDEQFQLVKLYDFTSTALKDGATLLLQSALLDMSDLHDYEKLATIIGKSKVPVYNAARWMTDVEFGRQILNGVNPVVIERCTKLPPNFPVTTDMVKGSLNRGKTLEEEMKEGHVYIADLKIMKDLPNREGQYCAAPICLLYVNGDNQLVPIAIQLEQEASEDNPIFLPSDHMMDWLLAKIFYQSAHLQFHQLSTHYFSCHAAMEAYAVATMRNLPDPHPIYKLLHPHFRYTMAINTAARATLVNDGGILDQLFAIGGAGKVILLERVSKIYQVQWTNIVQHAKERGVEDPNKLPGYYYRDDGIKIWNATKKFVEGIIDEFYSTDDDVMKDTEIQSWAEDVHTNGFPGRFGAKDGHGFPKEIATKKDLAEYSTLIMFTGSVQHASINFGQYDLYGFIPNAPSTLRLPPPNKKGVADYTSLLNTLPDKTDTARQIALANILSQYSHDEEFLGYYPLDMFSEETPQRLIKRFQKDLDSIAGDIQQRNKDLDVPYTYMLPGKIPNSITI